MSKVWRPVPMLLRCTNDDLYAFLMEVQRHCPIAISTLQKDSSLVCLDAFRRELKSRTLLHLHHKIDTVVDEHERLTAFGGEDTPHLRRLVDWLTPIVPGNTIVDVCRDMFDPVLEDMKPSFHTYRFDRRVRVSNQNEFLYDLKRIRILLAKERRKSALTQRVGPSCT